MSQSIYLYTCTVLQVTKQIYAEQYVEQSETTDCIWIQHINSLVHLC